MRSIFFSFLVLIGIVSVLYLSWLPRPQLGLMWFMPGWLANWVDAYENNTLRTGVPFIVLGVIVGTWMIHSNYSWYWWFASWIGLVTIVSIAETGQLLLPHRNFDWLDIAWGAAGAVIGMSIAIFGQRLKTLFAALTRYINGR